MRTSSQIAGLYTQRTKTQASDIAAMQEFEAYLRGDIHVAVAELDSNDKAAIANLAAQGLEQMALRVASTLPSPQCPPSKVGKTFEQRAKKRRQATLGWWDANDMAEILFLRSEHLLAHAVAPVTVLPDPVTGIPRWEVRDPKTCFPAPCRSPLEIVPDNCLFTSTQTWGWLCDRYKHAGDLKRNKNCKEDDPVTIVEYMDAHEIVTLATIKHGDYDTVGHAPEIELDRIPNRAKRPLAFVPGWATIVGRRGKFNGTIGAHQMRAKLLAIAYLTARKGAMPEQWVEPDASGIDAEIVSYPDPKTGEPGVIKGGRIREVQTNPGFMTSPMLSILEREIRLEGGIPAEFGGEAATGVRTGRRGDAILASTVDFPIQRAQRLLARSLTHESQAALHIVKEWTPAAKSFYVNWKGSTGWVDYDPVEDFDSDQINVTYALAGSDLNNETLRLQSKVGTDMISRRTAREQDPEIPDAEAEEDRIVAQKIDELFFGALAKKVDADESRWGPREMARLKQLVLSDKKDLLEAVEEIEADMQAETEAPPDAVPGALGAPAPSIPEPPEGVANAARLQMLLGGLNQAAA